MKIKISPLLILMAFMLSFMGYGLEFISYFVAIILHEMAHAQVAYRRGYSLNTLTLRPYGASLTGAFEGVTRKDEILIAIAGPLANIIIAMLFIALWWLIPPLYLMSETFVISNVCTAAFNCLPIFPLDGGRAVLALLSSRFKRENVYRVMRIIGGCFAALFFAAFVYSLIKSMNFSFAFATFFILLSTVFPDKNSVYRRLYTLAYRSEKLKNGLSVKEIMVGDGVTFLQMSRMLSGNYYHRFLIMDKNFVKIAEINETEFERLVIKYDNNMRVILALGVEKNLKTK